MSLPSVADNGTAQDERLNDQNLAFGSLLDAEQLVTSKTPVVMKIGTFYN